MKLRSIELEGFQSYRERERVDVAGLGLAAIVGENRAGKSTLISDALMFCLYGRSRGSTVNDVISRGEQKAEVAAEFDLTGTTYRIVRSRTRKGRHEVFVGVSDPDSPSGWRALSEKNPMQADVMIIELLGMDSTTAQATWMIGQNAFGTFCELMPSPRRAALAAAFGLDRFAELARAAELRGRQASTALEKAQYDHKALTDRLTALNAPGPFPMLDDTELDRRGHDLDARAESAGSKLSALSDPGLEDRLAKARRARALFEDSHTQLVTRWKSEQARLSAEVADARDTERRAVLDRDQAQDAVWDNDAATAFTQATQVRQAAEDRVGLARTSAGHAQQVPPALNAAREALKQTGLEVAERLRMLKATLSKGAGACFTCGQELSQDHANELSADLEEQHRALLGKHEQKGRELQEAAAAAAAAAQELQRQEQQLKQAHAQERLTEKEVERIRRLADSADQAEARAEAASRRREGAETALATLGTCPERDLAQAGVLEQSEKEAAAAVERANGGESARRTLEAERDTTRAEARRIWHEQARRTHVETERASLADPVATATQKLEDAGRDVTTLTVLHEAFRPSGIPAMILAGVVDELNDEANDILGGLGDDGLGVQVSTHREKARGGVEEKVMVYAITADGQADYKTLSGSEKFRVALALRLALARCIARRTGSPIETIVMDEGWGALDDSAKRSVQEVLTKLSASFDVFTVSHVEDIRDGFPNLIEVNKDTGTSRASITTR